MQRYYEAIGKQVQASAETFDLIKAEPTMSRVSP